MTMFSRHSEDCFIDIHSIRMRENGSSILIICLNYIEYISCFCAEATYALPQPRAAPAPGQDSAMLPHRSCEGRHLLSRGQPIQ